MMVTSGWMIGLQYLVLMPAQNSERFWMDGEGQEFISKVWSVYWGKFTQGLPIQILPRVAAVMEKPWNFWHFEIFWNLWKSHGISPRIDEGHGKVLEF